MALKAAILGASGYTGADMVRLVAQHPELRVVALSADRKAGMAVEEVLPHFQVSADFPALVTADQIDYADVDVVFGCLPHGTSQALFKTILDQHDHIRVVDLSADFRLVDHDVYAAYYGSAHIAPEWQQQAVYALPEISRQALRQTRLAACPGCYPTAALLALYPGLVAGIIKPVHISIMALSGVSGAGRSLKEANLFCEIAESMHPYALQGHRHMPEIEQELSKISGSPVCISFIPHLIPINRGELETIVVELNSGYTAADLRAAVHARYQAEPFVHLLPEGVAPATRMVRGSNHCVINVFPDRIRGRAIVVSCIDNLVKGSSGQALQAFNAMFGFDERLGLGALPLFP